MTQTLVSHALRPGPAPLPRRVLRILFRAWFRLRTAIAPTYRSPTEIELRDIEAELRSTGIDCGDLVFDPSDFRTFRSEFAFPPDYSGGESGGVYDEKLLEHFVAWKLLALDNEASGPYIDIAACRSPWAQLLRDRGLDAHAIDLEVEPPYSGLPYYHQGDATRSSFADDSIGCASMQCAYEMFAGDDDVNLIAELARILRPGGKMVVSPLYMHTHACYYQTQEYFGRVAGDPGARPYVRRDCWGVSASRKYSPETLRSRVWDTALESGLTPRLMALRNKSELGAGIYLHFVLTLEKPIPSATAGDRQ